MTLQRLVSGVVLRREPTLRLRLTVMYGSLFLVAGMVLLGVTYLLFSDQVSETTPQVSTAPDGSPLAEGRGSGADGTQTTMIYDHGVVLTGPEAVRWVEDRYDELQSAATRALLAQGAIALALVGGAATGLGWLIAGMALARLDRVTETAQRITAASVADRGLHERIRLHGRRDEVKQLADTFDTMVERLDRSFDGQRRFVANASHELRTPLTINRALVELALHRTSASPEIRQLGESLLQVNERHERLVSGLLLLARSDQEITHRSPVDLADIVDHVVAQAATEAGQAGIALHKEPGSAATCGDPLLLERLVHNLVENGIRHNHTGGWVRVVSRSRPGGGVEVEVSNTGPVIVPYDVPRLFEPFHRNGENRLVTEKSAGLGLSIVQAIAHAHHGKIDTRPRPGGGLAITVTLPAADP